MEESKIANSLKNVKNRINGKIRNIALCAAAVVLTVIVGFNLLFNIPIKRISLADISVTAHVYPLSEIIDNSTNDVDNSDVVTVFSDENDCSEGIMVNIPEIGTIILTVETARDSKDNTIYISAFKTTLLNNRAQDYQQQMNSLELQEINRIVFVENGGTETVLWSR